MDMFIEFNISYELLFISSSEWWWTKRNRKTNQRTQLHPFLSFQYLAIKIDKTNRLIAQPIDFHRFSILPVIDKFWLILIDYYWF